MVGNEKKLVWYRLRVPTVHPHPKIPGIPHSPPPPGQTHTTRPSKRRFGPKKENKKENMALIDNEPMQIINVFNYTYYT